MVLLDQRLEMLNEMHDVVEADHLDVKKTLKRVGVRILGRSGVMTSRNTSVLV